MFVAGVVAIKILVVLNVFKITQADFMAHKNIWFGTCIIVRRNSHPPFQQCTFLFVDSITALSLSLTGNLPEDGLSQRACGNQTTYSRNSRF